MSTKCQKHSQGFVSTKILYFLWNLTNIFLQNTVPENEEEWHEIIREHEEEQRSFQPPMTSQPVTPMSQLKSQLSKPLQDLSSPLYTATPISGVSLFEL